jgi:hypothetical protein
MKISTISVSGFRCLKKVEVEVEDYSVLIGANGSGKSSVLYALDWFFGNRPLAESDVFGFREGHALPVGSSVEVGVTFTDLTPKDRERLERYGRGVKAVLRRSWKLSDGSPQVKYVGNARQGDGFAAVRLLTRAPEYRRAYSDLRLSVAGLPDLGGSPAKDEIAAALIAWENDPANASALVDVDDDDATHMFGINGGSRLRDCVRMVLVPAAVNMASHVGETSTKASALTELVGAFMSDASSKAQAAWLAANRAVLEDLTVSVRESVAASTSVQASRINSRLRPLVPNATVSLTPSIPDWVPKADPTVAAAVTIDGITNEVGRQGHGIQRAVMIAVLQALVPDEELTASRHQQAEGEDDSAAAERLQEEVAALPALVVAIEEPEIYQHPARARAFARSLTAIASQAGVQVIVATHSPFFVRPEQFESLHRFTLESGETATARTTVSIISSRTGLAPDKIQSAIERNVPTEFSEGFFADKVVLVEGPTDRVVLEAVAARLGLDLDGRGISVLSVSGKESLRTGYEILRALGIPTYVLADGDFGGAARKHPNDLVKRSSAHSSHLASTERVIGWFPTSDTIVGPVPAVFGATTIAKDYALWEDDIEKELLAWPSLVAGAAALGLELEDRGDKQAMLYRQAVMASDVLDLPVNLRTVVEAVLDL